MMPHRSSRRTSLSIWLVLWLAGILFATSGCDRDLRRNEGVHVPQRTVDRILDHLNELRSRTDLPWINHFQLECDFGSGFSCRFASVGRFLRPTLSRQLREQALIRQPTKVRIRCVRLKGAPSSRCEIDRGAGFVLLPILK